MRRSGGRRFCPESLSHTQNVVGRQSLVDSATNEIDLRGPDVAANALRWLATVETADEAPDAVSINNGMSEGMGLLVVVTGDASSVAATQFRTTTGHDETLIVVCATNYTASNRFVVDATSTEAMIASWSVLIVGANQAVPT